MSKTKTEQTVIPKDSNNIFGFLNTDVAGTIASYLPVKDISNLTYHSSTINNLFAPSLNQHIIQLASKARNYVILGNPEQLTLIIKHNLKILFEKGRAVDLRNRIFDNISAYQLILFYCDKDMKDKIKPLIPKHLTTICKAQEAEMGHGGNDLIKLDHNTLLNAEKDFKGITEFEIIYTLHNRQQLTVTFPLLENTDGIICYQDNKDVIHFYYVNQQTKELKELKVYTNTEEEVDAFEIFKTSFNDMENNSGRRSNDKEHQLIEKILGCTLQRQGIQYEKNGTRYRDSRTQFKLINAYRTCIKLYSEAEKADSKNDLKEKAHSYWCTGVGQAQAEEMWVLQRICEDDKAFYPFTAPSNDFKRMAVFYNPRAEKGKEVDNPALINGKLIPDLGSTFAFSKAPSGKNAILTAFTGTLTVIINLYAIAQYVNDGKANIIDLEQENTLDLQENNNRFSL